MMGILCIERVMKARKAVDEYLDEKFQESKAAPVEQPIL